MRDVSAAAESAGRARGAAREVQIRADLARELHDGIVQTLTGMLMEIETYKAEQSGRSSAIDQLGRLQRTTRDVLGTLREVLTDLRGAQRSDRDFVVGVRRLASAVTRAHGIEVTVTAADWPDELPANVAMHLHRIARHAMQNMVLHSGAGRGLVQLDGTTPEYLVMTIEDNGSGVFVDDGSGNGLGLMGMQERAVLINGDLVVRPAPEGGTQVIVTVRRGWAQ
jgi:two-component system, NarL family, sensor histidine kinase UhpB